MRKESRIKLRLFVGGAHLIKKYGRILNDIEKFLRKKLILKSTINILKILFLIKNPRILVVKQFSISLKEKVNK